MKRLSELIAHLQKIQAEHGDIMVFNVEAMSREIDHVYKCRAWIRSHKKQIYVDNGHRFKTIKEKAVYFPVTGVPLY